MSTNWMTVVTDEGKERHLRRDRIDSYSDAFPPRPDGTGATLVFLSSGTVTRVEVTAAEFTKLLRPAPPTRPVEALRRDRDWLLRHDYIPTRVGMDGDPAPLPSLYDTLLNSKRLGLTPEGAMDMTNAFTEVLELPRADPEYLSISILRGALSNRGYNFVAVSQVVEIMAAWMKDLHVAHGTVGSTTTETTKNGSKNV